MEWWSWVALIVFLLFGPSVAGLLLWRKLVERHYIEIMPADVPDGNGEYLG